MLQAKIFDGNGTTIAGATLTDTQLSLSVLKFNGFASSGLVMFDDYPGASTKSADPERVAATAQLHLNGRCVIATITFLDTPMGKIAQQLQETLGLQILPVTTVIPRFGESEAQLQIRRLVIPSSPSYYGNNSPLKKVQEWVSGNSVENWTLFELKEHKY